MMKDTVSPQTPPKLPWLKARAALFASVIPLSSIDIEDERYRISRDYDLAALVASITIAGVLNPPRVRKKSGGFIVVTGFHRVKAMGLIGMDSVWVNVVAEKKDTDLSCSIMAVCDNAFHHSLTTMEQVRAVELLMPLMNVQEIVENAPGLLNMEMSQGRVQSLIELGTMPREIHDLVDESRLSLADALRLAHGL